MKKIILLSILLIVGCEDNSTEPAPEDCINDTLSNSLVGNWAGNIKLDTNYWNDIEIPDSIAYFLMTVDSNNMVQMKGYKCDGYDCIRIDEGGEESYEMITIEYHDTTYLVQTDLDDETPTFNLSKGFAYELEGNLLTIIDFGLSPVNRFTVERCEAEGSSSYCYFGCTDESNINFDATAIYDDGSCLYGVTGKVVDQEGEPIKDAAILLTYDLNDLIGRELSGGGMPTTSINLAVPTETHVLLWIEDMCGDTMAVLVDEVLPAGYHQIIWDATGVLEGSYKVHVVTSEFHQTQNLLLALLFYSDLEMTDGELMQTLQDTSYTHDYHAMTDVDGRFSIPFNCLSFGIEQIGMDENGNFDNWTIPYRTKLWIVHEGNAMFSTQTYAVDPDNDLYVEITTPN